MPLLQTASPIALLVSLVLAAGVAAVAYARGSLTRGGAACATAVGGLIMGLGGPVPGAALLAFFFTSSALSRYRLTDKHRLTEGLLAKGERRDALQVLANGGVAAALCALAAALQQDLWRLCALGALSAATADTWATEIGVLASHPPRDLFTLRPVPPGTSGAVSLPGCLGMAAGAGMIAGIAALAAPAAALAVLLAGVGGGLFDSLLGATVQERRLCPTCQAATEQRRHPCGTPTVLKGGVAGLDNDAVNALATLAGAAIALLLLR